MMIADTAFYEGILYSGLVTNEITGDVCGRYVLGLKEGVFKTRYSNGISKNAYTFKNNLLDGLCIEWYESGNLKSEGVYRKGQKDGLHLNWYDLPNRRMSMAYYVNGVLTDHFKSWYASGLVHKNLSYKNGVEDGLYEEWYDADLRLKLQCMYMNGVLKEQCKEWDINGNPIVVEFISTTDTVNILSKAHQVPKSHEQPEAVDIVISQVDSSAAYWIDNSCETRKLNWVEKVIEYYENTDVISAAGITKNGKRDSSWTFWFPNGKVERRGKYSADLEQGLWTYWDPGGDSLRTIEFTDGVPGETIDIARRRELVEEQMRNRSEFVFVGVQGVHDDSFMIRVRFDYPKNTRAKALMKNILGVFERRFCLLDVEAPILCKELHREYSFEFRDQSTYITKRFLPVSSIDSSLMSASSFNLAYSAHVKTYLTIKVSDREQFLYSRTVYSEVNGISFRELAEYGAANLLNNKIKDILDFFIGIKCKPIKCFQSVKSGRLVVSINGGEKLGVEVGSQFWVYDQNNQYWPVAKLLVLETSGGEAECGIIASTEGLFKEGILMEKLYAKYVGKKGS